MYTLNFNHKLSYLLFLFSVTYFVSCSDNEMNPNNEPTGESQNFEQNNPLLGTWSLTYPIDENRSVNYHMTFKSDSTAILFVGVLFTEDPTNNRYFYWRRNGDITLFYDSIFYKYRFDGSNINLTKVGYKIHSNADWEMEGYNRDANNYYEIPHHPSMKINDFWETSLKFVNNKIDITTFKINDVYRYDYDHNGYTQTSFGMYGYDEVDAKGNRVADAYEAALYGTGYDIYGNPIKTAAAASRRGENALCPITHDINGNILTDYKGNPLPMYYYNVQTEEKTQIQGGFPCIADQKHDGIISNDDICFVGSLRKQGMDTLSVYRSWKMTFPWGAINNIKEKFVHKSIGHSPNLLRACNQAGVFCSIRKSEDNPDKYIIESYGHQADTLYREKRFMPDDVFLGRAGFIVGISFCDWDLDRNKDVGYVSAFDLSCPSCYHENQQINALKQIGNFTFRCNICGYVVKIDNEKGRLNANKDCYITRYGAYSGFHEIFILNAIEIKS